MQLTILVFLFIHAMVLQPELSAGMEVIHIGSLLVQPVRCSQAFPRQLSSTECI